MIQNEELVLINGGGVKKKLGYAAFLAVGGFITLLVGIVDGFLNPNKCN